MQLNCCDNTQQSFQLNLFLEGKIQSAARLRLRSVPDFEPVFPD